MMKQQTKCSAEMTVISDDDIDIFYHMHRPRFRRPETRVLRHILITLNDSFIDNQRPQALVRIAAIRQTLLKNPQSFETQALKYSECPTALNAGLLGTVPRGQLYVELESVAFSLQPGELSSVTESPMGLHLLRCDSINAAQQASLAEASPAIRRHLEKMRVRQAS